MIILVLGTPKSGKSLMAEELSLALNDSEKYYLATMRVMDQEGALRVEKHRKQREGKGFVTIERGREITGAVKDMAHPEAATVLLECVSNLVGNELFENPVWRGMSAEQFADEMVDEIGQLAGAVHHLVIVSSVYPLSDPGYDEATVRYVTYLHAVNERLKALADEVRELS
jgi:adenosylcobinamide kinase/adenosylcobinamide-phosphate guanylyltransferase